MDAGAGDIEADSVCRYGFIGLKCHHVRVDAGVVVRGGDGLAKGHQSIDGDGVSGAGHRNVRQQAAVFESLDQRAEEAAAGSKT